MKNIINISQAVDNSGETPVVVQSNPVVTVIRQTPPALVITRYFYRLPCDCCCPKFRCDCDCFWDDGCNNNCFI